MKIKKMNKNKMQQTLETLRLKKGLGKDMKGKELRLKNY